MRNQEGGPGMSREDRLDELGTFLLDRWMLFEAMEGELPWSWEVKRWYELVFCILARAGQPELGPSQALSLTAMLADLLLLDLKSIVEFTTEDGSPDLSAPDLVLMLDLMERYGLGSDEAKDAITAIFEAALSLERQHDGMVQHYFRSYGDLMLDEMGKHFKFSSLSDEDARLILTQWLQNVLNMPVVLDHPAMNEVAEEFDVAPQDIVDVADDLNLNVAILDDILATAVQDEEW